MHLTNPASVPAALRPLLSPSPARRRRLLLEEGAMDCTISQGLDMRLNDFGLLSYQYSVITSGIGGSNGDAYRNALLDLRTGRWLPLRSQLRPDYELGLSSLLARHLLHDKLLYERSRAWRQRLGPLLRQERDTLRAATRWVQQELPGQGTPVFTGAGMELEYSLNSFVDATLPEHLTVFFPTPNYGRWCAPAPRWPACCGRAGCGSLAFLSPNSMVALPDFRPAGAALLLLAVLAGAYEGARWLPHAPVGPAATAPTQGIAPVATAPPADDDEPIIDPAHCPPQPLAFSETRRAGPRRYVGTVGGEWATAELTLARPDSISGRFYLWRSGWEYEFSQPTRPQPLVLALNAAGFSPAPQAGGQWRLARYPGAVLQGTWVDAAGRPRPFVLRESYQTGVRYDVLRTTLTGGQAITLCTVPTSTYEFLHVLGPAATRPPLSRVQCPAPAGRRARLRTTLDNASRNEDQLCVQLNDFQLLSYQLHFWDSPFEGTGDHSETNVLVDLATGRRLTLASQLRPGYAVPLRRLLARQMLPTVLVDNPNLDGWEKLTDHGQPVKLPYLPLGTEDNAEGEGDTFLFTVQGLLLATHRGPEYSIPYRELRPLVRPGTPLARMLKARGLW
jgi:hypothetical protein